MKFYLSILFNLIFSISLNSQSLDILEDQSKHTEREINILNETIEKLKNSEKRNIKEVELISKKLELQEKFLSNLVLEISTIEKDIELTNLELGAMKIKKKYLMEKYEIIINIAFKMKNKEDLLLYLISSETLNQALRRLRLIKDYNKKLLDNYFELESLIKKINVKLANLEKQTRNKIIIQANYILAKTQIERDKINLENGIIALKSREKELLIELNEKEKIKNQLQEFIRIENQKIENAKKQRTRNQIEIDENLTKNFEKKSELISPTGGKGHIVGFFGEYKDPTHKNIKRYNNGVDLYIEKESNVKSIFDGKVSSIFNAYGNSKTVIVRHGEYFSVYSNIHIPSVKVGDNLLKGDIIGSVVPSNVIFGNKPVSEFHFEIWKNNKVQNPEEWVKF